MQFTSDPQKCTKTSANIAANAFILSFIKAKKDVQLYPAGNAAVSESIQRMLQTLKDSYSHEEVVEILVEKDRLFVSGVEASLTDPRVKELALSFFRRGIRKILLDPCIPLDEIKILLGILNLTMEKIAGFGGIEKLSKQRNILHAVVEENAELMIFDGESFSFPEGSGAFDGDELEHEPEETTDTVGRLFVRIQEGDLNSLNHLRHLLKQPDLFSRLLEKFALQIEKVEEETDPAARVERLLKIIKAIGAASGHFSEEERNGVLQNLAFSVLDLSAGIRTALVSQGLLPNLALKSIESEILSRFPVSKLAGALLQNFEVSGATSSIMQSYFQNLKLDETNRIKLADTLRSELDKSGILTAEIEAVLAVESGKSDILVMEQDSITFPAPSALRLEYYPSERVLFLGDERSALLASVAKELQEPAADVMAPVVLELMRHEKVPVHYAVLTGKAQPYMEYFLEKREFEKAASFLQGLREEYDQKKQLFSQEQLEPLQALLHEFSGERRVLQLAAEFRNVHADGQDFERLSDYLKGLGSSTIPLLMQSLEQEESRHARLLICKAVARAGEKNIMAVAQKLKHPKWYVVRNAVSILGQTGSPACVPYLRTVLEHEDVRVRKEVLRAFAAIRSGEAIELLCLAMEDEDPVISKAALSWVAAIEVDQGVPILYRLLNARSVLKKDDEVLRLAIDALQAIANEPAVELLERLSHTRSLLRRKKAAAIRAFAGAALDKLAGEREHA